MFFTNFQIYFCVLFRSRSARQASSRQLAYNSTTSSFCQVLFSTFYNYFFLPINCVFSPLFITKSAIFSLLYWHFAQNLIPDSSRQVSLTRDLCFYPLSIFFASGMAQTELYRAHSYSWLYTNELPALQTPPACRPILQSMHRLPAKSARAALPPPDPDWEAQIRRRLPYWPWSMP